MTARAGHEIENLVIFLFRRSLPVWLLQCPVRGVEMEIAFRNLWSILSWVHDASASASSGRWEGPLLDRLYLPYKLVHLLLAVARVSATTTSDKPKRDTCRCG